MTSRGELSDRLWEDFEQSNPHASRIRRLLADRGDQVANDHIGLRTYGDARISVDVLAQPFLGEGYVAADIYVFEHKNLYVRHYEHPDPSRPKVVISALDLDAFSFAFQDTVRGLIDQLDRASLDRSDLPVAGRLWDLTRRQYVLLANESEYAAWIAAFGFCANHFTVALDALRSFDSLEALAAFLQEQGFGVNVQGGEIKGLPDAYLEQCLTLTDPVPVMFADGSLDVPGCYYEFSQRHPLSFGELFQEVEADSTDRISQRTDPL